MPLSLKDQNRPALFGLLALNLIVYYSLVHSQAFEPAEWLRAFDGLRAALPAVVALALMTVLNGLLTPRAKERLVFLDWEHPLPGYRAFSEHLPSDPRINAPKLERDFGPFPSSPEDQNKLWYRIYSGVRSDPAVAGVSRSYLLARDYSAYSFLLLLGLGGLSLAQVRAPILCITYMGALVVQLLVAMRAARNHAIRLVTTAMAVASASGN